MIPLATSAKLSRLVSAGKLSKSSLESVFQVTYVHSATGVKSQVMSVVWAKRTLLTRRRTLDKQAL
jgi:hypothetical protein